MGARPTNPLIPSLLEQEKGLKVAHTLRPFIFSRQPDNWKVASLSRFHQEGLSHEAEPDHARLLAPDEDYPVVATVNGGEKACRPILLTQTIVMGCDGPPSTGII